MSYFNIKSHAKINIALNVVGKTNALHKIESLVSFLDLHDKIMIRKIRSNKHKIKFKGEFSNNIRSNNTVSNLLKILDKKKLLKDKYQIVVIKNIPTKAGLGGGSMNAANILNFFIKKKFVKLKQKEVVKILRLIGSDTILGIHSKNLVLQSNNSIKTPKIHKKINLLLVKPDFGCSTKNIYSEVKRYSKISFNLISKNMFNIKHLKYMKNDLEIVAFKKYPKLKNLKSFLLKLPNIEFARMTGSGSVIIAYFNSIKMCKDAQKKVKKQFRNYWCKISKTI